MPDETPDDKPLTISRRKRPLTVPTGPNTSGLLRGHRHKPEYIAEKRAERDERTGKLLTRDGILGFIRELAADDKTDDSEKRAAAKLLLDFMSVEEDRPPANVTEWINACYQRSLAAEAPK